MLYSVALCGDVSQVVERVLAVDDLLEYACCWKFKNDESEPGSAGILALAMSVGGQAQRKTLTQSRPMA
jgi:hypothetical protein